MNNLLFAAAAMTMLSTAWAQPSAEQFTSRVITRGLAGPVEMSLGPDGYLWLTERTGKRVVRVNPADGAIEPAVTIPEVDPYVGQAGLLGIALHPDLLKGRNNDYVYVVFSYTNAEGSAKPGHFLKVRRFTYDAKAKTLGSGADVLTELPTGNDHVAGRIVYGPDNKLYVSIGDQGANFNRNRCQVNLAQEIPTAAQVQARDWNSYQGKILRINLDGSIPNDNPTINSVRSHIYSYGHRNVQGMVFAPDRKLYAAEHGQGSDDEVNLVEAGKNYGWPNVAGYRDDQSYVYALWPKSAPEPCANWLNLNGNDMTIIPKSVPVQKESDFKHPDFREPLKTFFTVPNGYSWKDSGNATAALSALGIYTAKAIPDWANSLLVLAMTKGRVYRMQLSPDGKSAGEPKEIFRSQNRYRDIVIAPDNRTFYLLTDVNGRTTDSSGAIARTLTDPGAIIEMKYTGK